MKDASCEGIDYTIEAKSQSSPYKVHKYWGRKPWNIVLEYIKAYTKEGDIVLDPYVGGGATAYEAIKAKRKVIAFDINPVATFITKCMLEPINTFDYELAFQKIKCKVKNEIEKLYLTHCKKCGKKATIKETIWKGYGVESTPIQITYRCTCSKFDLFKKKSEIDDSDMSLIRRINKILIPSWCPRHIEVPHHVKVYKPSEKTTKRDILEFFTHRNIIALSYLKKAIEDIKDESIKRMMLYAFSASLAQSSKLVSITQGSKKDIWKGSSWIVPGLYVLRKNCEGNVWDNFEIKFQRILKTKSEDFKDTIFYKPANNYEELVKGKGTAWIETRSADTLDVIPDKSIDFVFADPPYHEDISYVNQSGIFASWLGMDTELSKSRISELVVGKDKAAGKNKYYIDIQRQFSQIEKKIKPESKVVVAFESYHPEKWDGLVKSFLKAGMQCESVIFHPQSGSFGKAFRDSHEEKEGFRKPILGTYYMRLVHESQVASSIEDNRGSLESKINQEINSVLQKRQEPTPLFTILMHLYCRLSKTEILSLSGSLLEKIKSITNTSFVIKDNKVNMRAGYNTLKTGKSLGGLVKERIKRIIAKSGGLSSSKINNLVAPFFTKDETIDNSYIQDRIRELENEGFITCKQDNSYERLYRPLEKLINEGIEHVHAVYFLADIGKKFNFKVWIGEKFHRNRSGDINIGELSNVSKDEIQHILNSHDLIRGLDVIWLNKENSPIYYFDIQKKREEISPIEIRLSKKLLNDFKSVRRIIVGNKKFCDEIITREKEKWGYWDCLTFEDLENYNKGIASNRNSTDKSQQERTIFQETAEIKFKGTDYEENGGEGARHCTLEFLSPNITRRIKPGQFVALSCSPNTKIKTKIISFNEAIDRKNHLNFALYKDLFLLRRPFSVHRIHYKDFKQEYLVRNDNIPADFLNLLKGGYKSSFDVLFKIVGRGTEQLAKLKPGDKISILGPLGNGIIGNDISDVPLHIKSAYLVAGGIGIAPLYSIAERLRWLGIKVKLIAGGEENLPLHQVKRDPGVEGGYRDNQVESLAKEFTDIGCEVCTVLASKKEGNVVDRFENIIEEDKNNGWLDREHVRIYSCGPSPMLKAVAKIANREDVECEVLLEKRMACCIGTCLSCVCDVKERQNGQYSKETIHKRVCYDGPVFNAKEVSWENL